MGNTCTRRTVNNVLDSLANNHNRQLENFITTAMENEWLLILIIDDYTNIHTLGDQLETIHHKLTICVPLL